MKNLSILPSIDDPKNTNFLKFEWNLFSICSSDNVCESAIYIVPIPSKDKLFHLVLGEGCLQRVHQEVPTCTTSKVQLQRRGCLSVECLF